MDLSRFRAILRTLANHGVDFIVVGGIAAVLDGVPAQTFDLDVAHSRAAENLPHPTPSGSRRTSHTWLRRVIIY